MLAVERPTEDRRRIIKGSDETGCAALKLLEREIQRTIKAARAHAPLHAHVDAPGKACSELTGTVEALLPTLANDSERALANANAEFGAPASFSSMSALAGVLFKRAGSVTASLFYKTGCSSWAEKCSQARGFLHATKRHQLFEDGENVKTVNLLKALGIALCVATASSAYAQSSDAMASGEMAAPSAKTVKKADRSLGLQVRKALAKAQGFDVSNVFVRARDGAVTLTGTVPDGAQIPQAEQVAKSVAGVKSVNNRLTIGTQGGGGGG